MSRYTGHVPEGDRRLHEVKCTLNTRVPLQQRIAPLRSHGAETESGAPRRAQSAGAAAAAPQSFFLMKRSTARTTYDDGARSFVCTAADVPPRRTEPVAASAAEGGQAATFCACSTTRLATAQIAEPTRCDFFSAVRKLERADDDARRNVTVAPTRAGASHFQRTVDIMRRREGDPAMQPPCERWRCPARRGPNGTAPPSAAERVHFTHLSPPPCSQLDFRAPRQVLAAHQATLASAPAARCITELASSCDLFAGTAKARADVSPGFMGHVPAHPRNSCLLQGPRDLLRLYSKSHAAAAAASAASAAATSRASRADAAGQAPAADPAAAATVHGFHERLVFADPSEQRMNRVEFGRRNAVRSFFSAGAGEADATLADQFCVKYRPGGGAMKIGAPSTWGWGSAGNGNAAQRRPAAASVG